MELFFSPCQELPAAGTKFFKGFWGYGMQYVPLTSYVECSPEQIQGQYEHLFRKTMRVILLRFDGERGKMPWSIQLENERH